MASSLARNLDYLSLDPHYEQHQDHIRRHNTPKGLGEGIQQGLSSLGLCLLSAVAGVADQPLQAIFNTINNPTTTVSPEDILDSSVDIQSTQSNFLLSTLGGFGRGLVGVVTKPAAGAAELIAQTSKGLLHRTSNPMDMTFPNKYGEPYISSEAGLRLHYQNVDSMILCNWGSLTLTHAHSNFLTSDCNSGELSFCSWFSTEIHTYNIQSDSSTQSHSANDMVIWIAASLDLKMVYASVITSEINNSYFSWFEHLPNKVFKSLINNVIGAKSNYVKLTNDSFTDKCAFANPCDNSQEEMSVSFNSHLSDSWEWIDHIQFNSNDMQRLKSVILNFWLRDERLKMLTHNSYSESNSDSRQEHTIHVSNSVDLNSNVNSSDLFPSVRYSFKWKRVSEYLMGISLDNLMHI